MSVGEGSELDALALRPSMALDQRPAERAAAAPVPPPGVISGARAWAEARAPDAAGIAALTTWGMAGIAILASTGWLIERRRRRLLEGDKDSVLWADVLPRDASTVTTVGSLNDILPDSPDPAEAARAIYVTGIGETTSRREATLTDLQLLASKLRRRHKRGDTVAAVLLLQQHLVDFRYTSPWVFLELRELYKLLGRQQEWESAREVFRIRFGQNAPAWSAPSSERAELLDDAQLCRDIAGHWPEREARLVILRWMLGEHEMRHKSSGPPQLGLGIYRDLMLLDKLLDQVIVARPVPIADSML